MKTLITFGLLCASVVASAMPEPTVWFCAADAVTNEEGVVTEVPNRGSTSASFPRIVPSAETCVVKVDASAEYFGGQPTLLFDGTGYLKSEATTSLGFPTGSAPAGMTWFCVYRMDSTVKNYSLFGLHTPSASSKRFCSFLTQNGTKWVIRSPFCKYDSNFDMTYQSGCQLASVMAVKDSTYDGHGFMGSKNISNSTAFWASGSRVWSDTFMLGNSGCNWADAKLLGRIAEIRIYNDSMTSADRFCIEGELAAYYAMALTPDANTTIDAGTLAGHFNDPCAFGVAPKGKPVASPVTSGTSGDLELSFADALAETENALVYAGHDAAEDGRSWCVAGTTDARQHPLVLTKAIGSGIRFLYYRADSDSPWTELPVGAVHVGTAVTFTLQAGWSNGQYRFDETRVPAVWFRADKGVTLSDDGKVQSWQNLGTYSGLASVSVPVDKTSGLTVVNDSRFASRPVVNFDGSTFLISDGNTKLGIDSASGLTVFAVYDVTYLDNASHQDCAGIFGLKSSNTGSWRFGLDYHTGNSNDRYRRFFTYKATPYIRPSRQDFVAETVTLSSVYHYQASSSSYPFGMFTSGERETPYSGSGFASVQFGTVQSAPFTVGRSLNNDKALFGNIAEIRVYTKALTPQEQSEIELELGRRYGLDVKATGVVTPETQEGYGVDQRVIGDHTLHGRSAGLVESWSDEAMTLGFLTTPADNANSLTSVGSNGASVEPKKTGGLWGVARKWHVSSKLPSAGGVFTFDMGTEALATRRWKLTCTKDGADKPVRVASGVRVPGTTKVAFEVQSLDAGVYGISECAGLIIVVE